MDKGGTRIRPATEHDVEALGRLGALLMRAHYAFDPRLFMGQYVEVSQTVHIFNAGVTLEW